LDNQRPPNSWDSDQFSALLALLSHAWGNVQHNERLRNVLFSLYLAVTSGFFAVAKFLASDGPQEALVLSAAILVGVVGLLFMWVFLRFRFMIERDMAVIQTAYLEFSRLALVRPVTDVIAQYRRNTRSIFKSASVTHAFILATGMA
jgi:hypothetical protein